MIRLWQDTFDDSYCFADHTSYKASNVWATSISDAIIFFKRAVIHPTHSTFNQFLDPDYRCILECESMDNLATTHPELFI